MAAELECPAANKQRSLRYSRAATALRQPVHRLHRLNAVSIWTTWCSSACGQIAGRLLDHLLL